MTSDERRYLVFKLLCGHWNVEALCSLGILDVVWTLISSYAVQISTPQTCFDFAVRAQPTEWLSTKHFQAT